MNKEIGFNITRYLKAGYAALFIETNEIKRCVKSLRVDEPFKKLEWDFVSGISLEEGMAKEEIDHINILTKATELSFKAVVLENYDVFLENSAIVQTFLNNYELCKSNQVCLVIVGNNPKKIPITLKELIPVIQFDLPTREETQQIVSIISKSAEADLKHAENYDKIKDQFDFSYTDEIVSACLGLSHEEMENALALSLIDYKRFNIKSILDRKRQIIKSTGFMDFMNPEPIENLGGLDKLKDYIYKRKEAFTDGSIKPKLRSVLLVGFPGCLSADTKIMVSTGGRKSGREYTIEEAYRKFNHIDSGKPYEKGNKYFWFRNKPIQTLALKNDNTIGYHDIEEILYSGKKHTYIIKTETGKKLRVTAEHPFKVPDGTIGADKDGFKKLQQLKVGDFIICRAGLGDYQAIGRNKNRKELCGDFYHPYASKKTVNGYTYNRINYARLVVEADLNDMSIEQFEHILSHQKHIAKTLCFIDPKEYEVHHKDFNPSNDDHSNLEVLTKTEHLKIHGQQAKKHFGNQNVKREKIVKIKKFGFEKTYDIIMKAPYHNYVANGMVVHNTGKSLAAKCMASIFDWPLIQLDVGAMKGGIVGETEKNVRLATKTIDAFGKAILLIDEIEKALAGASGQNLDSGVSAGMLGTLLTWFQERSSEGIVVATANDLNKLPPEFLRAGRFDTIFVVDTPNETEIKFIIEIMNRRYQSKLPTGEEFCKQLEEEQWTGAEIEQLAKDSHFDDLETAMNNVPLLADFRKDDIEEIRKKAKQFRAASSKGGSIRKKLPLKQKLVVKPQGRQMNFN